MKKVKRKSAIKIKPGEYIVLRGGLKLENVALEHTIKIEEFIMWLLALNHNRE